MNSIWSGRVVLSTHTRSVARRRSPGKLHDDENECGKPIEVVIIEMQTR